MLYLGLEERLGRQRRLSESLTLYHCCSIHNLGLVGHIEDIAVAKDQQGKKLGLRIIQTLDHVAAQVGCYKVCLLEPAAESPFFFSMLIVIYRAFLTAPRSTRVSTISAASSVLVSKWPTTTETCY